MVSLTIQLDQDALRWVGEIGPTDELVCVVAHDVLRNRGRQIRLVKRLAEQILECALGDGVPSPSCLKQWPDDPYSPTTLATNTGNDAFDFAEREEPRSDPLLESMLNCPLGGSPKVDDCTFRACYRQPVDHTNVAGNQVARFVHGELVTANSIPSGRCHVDCPESSVGHTPELRRCVVRNRCQLGNGLDCDGHPSLQRVGATRDRINAGCAALESACTKPSGKCRTCDPQLVQLSCGDSSVALLCKLSQFSILALTHANTIMVAKPRWNPFVPADLCS